MSKTSLMRKNNARAYVRFLRSIGVPFKMICSNYTVSIESEVIENKFVNSMQSNRVFACYAKILSDVKNKPTPEVDIDKLTYFVHNFKQEIYIDEVLNIDLKSAYATILYNDGYISKDTLEYISKGKKQERLVSVGMLASKKHEFDFDHGKIVRSEEITGPFQNFFFHAVKRTSEIMDELRLICKDEYLFTWVDGIYLLPNSNTAEKCEEYLNSVGFNFTRELLREFDVKITKKDVRVSFLKWSEKKQEWKRKPFALPHANSAFKKLMVDAILSSKQ